MAFCYGSGTLAYSATEPNLSVRYFSNLVYTCQEAADAPPSPAILWKWGHERSLAQAKEEMQRPGIGAQRLGGRAPWSLTEFLKFWLLKISVRGPFGIRARSARGPCGVRSGFARGPRGVRSGSVRDLFEGRTGSARAPFGIRSGSVRGPFGIRSGSVGVPFGFHSGPKMHINYCELTLDLRGR